LYFVNPEGDRSPQNLQILPIPKWQGPQRLRDALMARTGPVEVGYQKQAYRK
jgi:hypothetical protein